MGQSFMKQENFNKDIIKAFEDRFMKEKCINNPNKYVSLYIFAYELAFFFRNDPVQIVIESQLKKLSNHLEPTPDDWLVFTLNFINFLIKKKRLTKYGHYNYPVILGIELKD